MIQTLAKQKGITERGNRFTLSQHSPHIIQLTMQNGDYVISETLESIRSEAEMIERRTVLENELLKWMSSTKQLTENTNEADD